MFVLLLFVATAAAVPVIPIYATIAYKKKMVKLQNAYISVENQIGVENTEKLMITYMKHYILIIYILVYVNIFS